MPADVPAPLPAPGPAPVPAGPGLPPPRRSRGPYRVCLVCLGNICRSPMAEVALRAELDRAGLAGLVEVDSAGTGDWHLGQPMAEQAAAELARRGYDGSAHRARKIQRSWFGQRDLILAMDLSNLAALRTLAPDAEASGPRLMLFRSFDPDLAGELLGDPWDGAVPDPYGGPQSAYAQALDLVQGAVRGLAGRLAEVAQVPAALPSPGPEVPASGPGEA
ncbi:MAG: low molecular weight protein-tyrosine-phosphatase [Streptosporangiaceae bacterium]